MALHGNSGDADSMGLSLYEAKEGYDALEHTEESRRTVFFWPIAAITVFLAYPSENPEWRIRIAAIGLHIIIALYSLYLVILRLWIQRRHPAYAKHQRACRLQGVFFASCTLLALLLLLGPTLSIYEGDLHWGVGVTLVLLGPFFLWRLPAKYPPSSRQ